MATTLIHIHDWEGVTVYVKVNNSKYHKFNKVRYTLKRFIEHAWVTENGWTWAGWFNMYNYEKNAKL